MTIPAARRLIEEVLNDCAIDARARSLLQKALAETWKTAPIVERRSPLSGHAYDAPQKRA